MSFLFSFIFSAFAMESPKALITGITGQDGPYLAQFLLDKGYEVIGTYRRNSHPNFSNIKKLGIKNRIRLEMLEITDYCAVIELLNKEKPNEVYHRNHRNIGR